MPFREKKIRIIYDNKYMWNGLQWHHAYTKFEKNAPADLTDIMDDKHTLWCYKRIYPLQERQLANKNIFMQTRTIMQHTSTKNQ